MVMMAPSSSFSSLLLWSGLLSLSAGGLLGFSEAARIRASSSRPPCGFSDCGGTRRVDPVIAEAREVSRLSDEIARMESKIDRWEMRYAKAKAYHEKITELKKQQIAIRKRQMKQRTVTGESSEDEYREKKEKYYKYMMCNKLLNAFFFDDNNHDAKLEVLHLCMGRKSLALFQGPPSNSSNPGFLGTKAEEDEEEKKLEAELLNGPSLEEELEDLMGESASFLAAETRLEKELNLDTKSTQQLKGKGQGPADDLQRKLDAQKREYTAVRQRLFADQKKWREERNELAKEEQALAEDVYQEKYDKTAIKKEAWMKVKGEFCPVINESYRIDDDKIVEHAMKECS